MVRCLSLEVQVDREGGETDHPIFPCSHVMKTISSFKVKSPGPSNPAERTSSQLLVILHPALYLLTDGAHVPHRNRKAVKMIATRKSRMRRTKNERSGSRADHP
jgi:hypothetical protein